MTSNYEKKSYPDGSISERHLENGELHRSDGPALFMKRSDGSTLEGYYRRGQLHREDGPALISREPDGTTIENHFLDGICQDEDWKEPSVKWTLIDESHSHLARPLTARPGISVGNRIKSILLRFIAK